MALRMPTKVPTRKLLAGTAGGMTIGPSVGELLVYAIETIGKIDLPDRIETAIVTIVIGIAFLATGYLTPPAREDTPVPDQPARTAGIP